MPSDADRAGSSPQQESPPGVPIAIPATTPSVSPPIGAYMTPAVGFPPGFYSQYPAPGQPGEPPTYFPQFYIAQVPPPQPTANGETPAYPPHTQFYPAFVPFPQPYPYIVPHQPPDGQIAVMPYPMYKPPSSGHSSEPVMRLKKPQAHAAREQEEEEEEEAGDS